MGEGVDAELEGFEAGREVFDAVELVSPRALGAFDVAVELGPLRRQDEEAQVALSACLLELGPELRPAIDLDTLDAEGDLGDELVERSEEHTSELQSHSDLVCRLLLEKKKKITLALSFLKKQT